jgi:signal transduction histidine kinase
MHPDNLVAKANEANDSVFKVLELFTFPIRFSVNPHELDKEEINLNKMISDVIQDHKAQLGKANTNIQLVYEFDKDIIIIVEADKSRLAQVISNLPNNAIKFTREGVISVKTTIKKELDSNEVVVVSVRDTGIGIEPKILPRLFSRFASKSFSGTGLGLFISKGIVEAYGGTIWAEDNSAGQGSTFSFSLPFSSFPKINSTSLIQTKPQQR